MIGRIFYTLFLFFLLFTVPMWVGVLLMIFGMYVYPLYIEAIVLMIIYQTLFLPTTASMWAVLVPLFLAVLLFIIEKIKPLLRQ